MIFFRMVAFALMAFVELCVSFFNRVATRAR